MPLPSKVYYLSFRDFYDTVPFTKLVMKYFLLWVFDQDLETGELTNFQVPSDLTTNASIYNEFMSLVYGVYNEEDIVKIVKRPDEAEPTADEYTEKAREWGYKFVSLLNMTYEYYMPLLTFYRANKSNLMDDITATSKNKVKFNDTPQNANTLDVYEGDNYITHFTATENESKSPLASKIMRLKEIQENYKNVMYDWVKTFERLFYEGAD